MTDTHSTLLSCVVSQPELCVSVCVLCASGLGTTTACQHLLPVSSALWWLITARIYSLALHCFLKCMCARACLCVSGLGTTTACQHLPPVSSALWWAAPSSPRQRALGPMSCVRCGCQRPTLETSTVWSPSVAPSWCVKTLLGVDCVPPAGSATFAEQSCSVYSMERDVHIACMRCRA